MGLLLGAGASYELGMPLVRELTAEFKAYLTPRYVASLNEGWRAQGAGYSERVAAELDAMIADPALHYEAIIGYFQIQANRASPDKSAYAHLSVKLTDAVYGLLYSRHIRNVEYVEQGLRFFDGIAGLVEQNVPLWIFSLNHDMMIECVARTNGLPLSAGLVDRLSIPRRDRSGRIIGEILTESMRGDVLETQGLKFLAPGERGINLMKIHGGLDVFMMNDGKDIVRLLPLGNGVAGVVEALRAAHEDLGYTDPATGIPFKVVGDEPFVDAAGEVQLLQRSILTGRFKYDTRHHQVLPKSYLTFFRSYVNRVESLACIGYGFGDEHINAVLRDWLEADARRTLEIVMPGEPGVPTPLLHLKPQIKSTSLAATEWLEAYSPSPLSPVERMLNVVRIAQR